MIALDGIMAIRLIDTTTLKLRVFTGEFPEYGILSHTWTMDEEVDFQEMTGISKDHNHPAATKPGYRKIQAICSKAKSHGLQFTWVDTCCIDKTSSAELSEAINSMFKWYQKAVTCYVYLEDLPAKSDLVTSFQHCRWFTRGWCLQELLAPKDLRFYNQLWKFVGAKSRLKKDISKFTGIGEDVLGGTCPLRNIPVARRMSWASGRKTTRVEDVAYCLLGIFDINMPMLYGEGDKAFLRLQEEIMRRSNDLSIFWQSEEASLGSDADMDEMDEHVEYQNLLARSPADFGFCNDVCFKNEKTTSHLAFELTNSGVHFKGVELLVRPAYERPFEQLELTGIYIMPLGCRHSDEYRTECRIYLRKVGPGVFVRVFSRTAYLYVGGGMYPLNEEVYIIPVVSRELRNQLDMSHAYAIHFDSENTRDLTDALQGQVPRDQWDAPDLQFLTFGESSFEGYVKVFPHLAGGQAGRKEAISENFYVACGLEASSPPRVWVRLFAETNWLRHEKSMGKMVSLKYLDMTRTDIIAANFEQDELRIGDESTHVKVLKHAASPPRFTIRITFPRSRPMADDGGSDSS